MNTDALESIRGGRGAAQETNSLEVLRTALDNARKQYELAQQVVMLEKQTAEELTKKVAIAELIEEKDANIKQSIGKYVDAQVKSTSSQTEYDGLSANAKKSSEHLINATGSMFGASKGLFDNLGANVKDRAGALFAGVNSKLTNITVGISAANAQKDFEKRKEAFMENFQTVNILLQKKGDLESTLRTHMGNLANAPLTDLIAGKQQIQDIYGELAAVTAELAKETAKQKELGESATTAFESMQETSKDKTERQTATQSAVEIATQNVETSNNELDLSLNLTRDNAKDMFSSLGESVSANTKGLFGAVKNAFTQFKNKWAIKSAGRNIDRDIATKQRLEAELNK